MIRKVKPWLLFALSILLFAGIIAGFAWIFQPRPVTIDLNTPVAVEGMSLVKKMYLFESNIICVPGTTVDMLAEIMVDSSDYHATVYDKNTIEWVFGRQALAHAGLLTAKQAYYLSRDLPAATPTHGTGPLPRPTATPAHRCSTDPGNYLDEHLRYVSVAQWQDGRIVVTYDYNSGASGRFEAILRAIDGKWKITSIKMIKFYGNG